MPVARKTTARPRTTARVPEPEARPEALIVLKRSRVATPSAERVLVFAYEYDDGGEPREFWVAKRAMASLALRYMHMVRTKGADVAAAWALEEVLGADAYEALMSDDQLDTDDLATILDAVQGAMLGAVQDPKGRSR